VQPVVQKAVPVSVEENVEMKDEESKAPISEPIVEPKIERAADEWQKIKLQNSILNTDLRRTDVDATLKN
jgi:hypothetical protein